MWRAEAATHLPCNPETLKKNRAVSFAERESEEFYESLASVLSVEEGTSVGNWIVYFSALKGE